MQRISPEGNTIDTKIIICPHCEGTKFCKPQGAQPGCSYCISEYQKHLRGTTTQNVPLFLVPCAFCNNIGFIHQEPVAEEPLPVINEVREEEPVILAFEQNETIMETPIISGQPFSHPEPDSIVMTPGSRAVWLINLATALLTGLFFLLFLLLCYKPNLFDIRYALIPVGSLIWILVVVLSVFFLKSRVYQNAEFISATVEPEAGKKRVIVWTHPLFRFIFLSIAVNTVLFFVHLYGHRFSPLNSTPVAQMEILPAFFSFVMLGICIIERWQARKDPTIRIVALAGAAIIMMTYLVYLKTSLASFWSHDILFLLIAAMFGLAVITAATLLS